MKTTGRARSALSVLLALAMWWTVMTNLITAAGTSSPVLTLEAVQGELAGPASKHGSKVGSIGKNGGEREGTVTFRDLALPADGYYTLRVHYYSGSDDRYFNLYTPDGTVKLPTPSTGGFDRIGTAEIDLRLEKGGWLTAGSDWYGPDLGLIEVFLPEDGGAESRTYADPDVVRVGGEDFALLFDRKNGVFSVEKDGGIVLENIRGEVVLDGGTVASHDFASHSLSADGDRVTFTHEGHPDTDAVMIQTFLLRAADSSLLTETEIRSPSGVSTNRITPVALYGEGVHVPDGVFLSVPFDNDMWAEPSFASVERMSAGALSHEVFALYSADTGAGVAAGSVEHGVWKTGIEADVYHGEWRGLRFYGGAADENTHDVCPHGTVSGTSVKSPRIFLTVCGDWRDGLLACGRANAEAVPPKKSAETVPFGYNSWGVLQDKVSLRDMTAVSDYIRENLQEAWAGDGSPVYVNIDSFWDFLAHNDPDFRGSNEDALRLFVAHCRENGQEAGIYFTPFACWHGDEDALKKSAVEGTGYTYYDAALKKEDGTLWGKLDGGYALDPTHPATVARFEKQLRHFIELGFTYVKLDFMTHGALEGVHYDPSVSTGLEAYNAGMEKIRAVCGGHMIVNLSIAPLFPYQYADGRRISCDAFSSLDNTRHVLSCLTAGFWEKEIYPWPDPDHLVVWGKDGRVTEGEARCRVTCGAISGTSFLVGDNLADIVPGSEKEKRILAMFANPGVIGTAKRGEAFRPWSVIPGEKCADAFWYAEGEELWLAVFNFDDAAQTRTFDLSGLLPEGDCAGEELWRGTEADLDDRVLTCEVPARDAALWHVSAAGSAAEPISTDPAADQAPSRSDIPGAPDSPDPAHKEETLPSPAGKSRSLLLPIAAAAVVLLTAGIALAIRRNRRT